MDDLYMLQLNLIHLGSLNYKKLSMFFSHFMIKKSKKVCRKTWNQMSNTEVVVISIFSSHPFSCLVCLCRCDCATQICIVFASAMGDATVATTLTGSATTGSPQKDRVLLAEALVAFNE